MTLTSRKLIIAVATLTTLASVNCTPPPISLFRYQPHQHSRIVGYIHLDTGESGMPYEYSMSALQSRLDTAYSVELVFRNGLRLDAHSFRITPDSVECMTDSGFVSVCHDSVRKLLVYSDSWFMRTTERALPLGAFFGGLALLAYIPPNPSNEPPYYTVFIAAGGGVLLGTIVGDNYRQRETIIFATEHEVAPFLYSSNECALTSRST
jgi:hypothetical protein